MLFPSISIPSLGAKVLPHLFIESPNESFNSIHSTKICWTSQIWFQTALSENLEHIQIYLRQGVITAVSCILQEKGRPLSLREQGRLNEKATFILVLKNEQNWSRWSWKWGEERKKRRIIPMKKASCLQDHKARRDVMQKTKSRPVKPE